MSSTTAASTTVYQMLGSLVSILFYMGHKVTCRVRHRCRLGSNGYFAFVQGGVMLPESMHSMHCKRPQVLTESCSAMEAGAP